MKMQEDVNAQTATHSGQLSLVQSTIRAFIDLFTTLTGSSASAYVCTEQVSA
jgi:hypothetical protein